MAMPTNEPTNASSRGSGARRWAALREAGWLAKQIGLYVVMGVRLVASFARQRGLQASRGRILQGIGEQLRQGAVPETMRARVDACEGYDQEIKDHREALASQEPTGGWLSRARRRMQLLGAQRARSAALRRLGAGAIALVPPEKLAPYQAVETDLAGEQARRDQLREPWRALSSLRRMAVHVTAVLLFTTLVVIGVRFSHVPAGELLQTTSELAQNELSQSLEQPENAASAMQTDPEKIRNLPLEFVQQRAAAAPGTWSVYTGNPVIQRGMLEDWDNFTVGAPVVLKQGNRYRMWYRGCYFIGLDYTCGVGHATSADGISWHKAARPVFVPDDAHESARMNSLAVVRASDRYLMWYSVKPNYFIDRPYASIHLATSADGFNWQPGGLILRSFSRYTPAIEPSAFHDGKLFHLWYADYYPSDAGKALLHVTSQDGKHWKIAGSMSLNELKVDPGRLSVFPDGRGGYRAYFAHERTEQSDAGVFGMLLSADGSQWVRAAAGVKLASRDIGNSDGFAVAPAALVAPDGLWVWFAMRPDDGAEEIRLAFLKEGTP